jgi:uracil-DNA glycosylase family 4
VCPYAGKRQVKSITPENPSFMVIGEAPGATEEARGEPFVGESGRFLNWALGQAGVYRPSVWFSNVINCRPPSNDITSIESQDAISCCKAGLWEEVDAAYDAGARVILALGNTAAGLLLSPKESLTKIRGSVYTIKTPKHNEMLVVPTYHPSSIMRHHWKRSGGGTADDAVLWLADIKKAVRIAKEGWSIPEEKFILTPKIEDVRKFYKFAISKKPLLSVDIETTGLDPTRNEVVVIGFAWSESEAISIPFVEKGSPYWSIQEEAEVWKMVTNVLETCPQIYQNCLFDVPFLIRSKGIPAHPLAELVVHDTLLLHHTLAPELHHDLGTIASLYGKTPYWKEVFKGRKVTIHEMDQLEMREYNLRDCIVPYQAITPMLADIEESGLMPFYKAEVQPLLAPLIEMSVKGISIDATRVTAFKKRITSEVKTLEEKLRELGNLPPEFNLGSEDHVRYFLFGEIPTSFKHIPELDKKRAGTKIYQQLLELKNLRDNTKPIFLLPSWTPPKTKEGKSRVNKEGLLSFQIQLNNYYQNHVNKENLAAIEKLQDWLILYNKFSAARKLSTSFSDYKAQADGRIRPQWKVTGTVSGRLSCEKPNLMQCPKPKDDPEDPASQVRAFFKSKEGWSYVSCDYVNLEAQLLAYETLDPVLIDIFESGKNLHDINTRDMFKIDKENSLWSEARKAAKIFFFGGISYGGGDITIYRKCYLAAPKLNLTFADFTKARKSWFDAHPHYVAWKKALTEEVTRERLVKTEFGRIRQFLSNDESIVREALDFKIQSAGASLVNRAMSRIYKEKMSRNMQAFFVLQIHDQLVMECPDSEVESVKEMMVRQLEAPFTYKGFTRHIPVDCSVGKSLAEL